MKSKSLLYPEKLSSMPKENGVNGGFTNVYG